MIRPGQTVVLCALALLAIGVVMVNSASMHVATIEIREDGATEGIAAGGVTFQSILMSPAARHMLLALGALTCAAYLPVGSLARLAEDLGRFKRPIILTGLCAGVLLVIISAVYWPGLASPRNGSYRWIRFGPIDSFQPSEIAKWAIVWLVAAYCVWIGRERLRTFWFGFVPIIGCVSLVSALVIKEDLGTGVLMAAAAGLVLLAAGARWRHFALFFGAGVAGIVAAIVQNPYRIDRIVAFIDPYADPQGTGFHMIQSLATVSGGGMTGRGLGHGLQKFGYLPEDQTDFLFAVICEELGLGGAALILGLYAILAWTILSIVNREPHPLLRLGGFGVLATLTIQAMINLIVVTGLGPTKGIALPLLSAGGSGWVLTAGCLGILVAMDRHHERTMPQECLTEPVPS